MVTVCWLLWQPLQVPGQTNQAKTSSLSARQKQMLMERDALIPQAKKLWAAGQLDQAARGFEKMMALEKAIFGPVHEEVAGTLDQLGDIHVSRGDLEAARTAGREALAIYVALRGDRHWRTINARLALADVEQRLGFTAGQREQWSQAEAQEQQANQLYDKHKYAAAEAADREALAIRRRLLAAHLLTARSHLSLASDLRGQNKYRQAEAEDDQALAIHRELLGKDHPALADDLAALAADARGQGNYRQAEARDRQALAIQQKFLGGEHPDTLRNTERLAIDLAKQGRWAEAVGLRRHILGVQRRLHGPDHEDYRTAARFLGIVLSRQVESLVRDLPRPTENRANGLEKRLRAVAQLFWGADAPTSLERLKAKLRPEADLLHQLAYELRAEGLLFEGNLLERLAFSLRLDLLGQHRDTIESGRYLAWGLYRARNYQEAEAIDRLALAMAEKALGGRDPLTLQILDNLAYDVRDQGRYTEAEPLDRRSLKRLREVHGEQHKGTARMYNNLAYDLRLQGRIAEAEPLFRKALLVNYQVLGPMHSETLLSYNNLATILRDMGRFSEAEQLDLRIMDLLKQIMAESRKEPFRKPVDLMMHCRNLHNLAVNSLGLGQFKNAEQLLEIGRHLVNLLTIASPHDHAVREFQATYHESMGQARLYQGKIKEAVAAQKEALKIRRELFGARHPVPLRSEIRLAELAEVQGDFAQAECLLEKSIDLAERALGADHPRLVLDRTKWVRVLWAQGKSKNAEQTARIAVAGFQKARLRISSSGLERSSFAVEEQTPMVYLAALLAQRGKPREAWKHFEDNLGRGLLDDLSARASRPLTPSERREEESLHGQIAQLDKALSTLPEKKLRPKADRLRQGLNQRLVQLNQLQARLEKKYGPAAGEVYGLEKIQAYLAHDTALVGWLDIDGHPRAKDPGGSHWSVVVRHQGPPIWVALRPFHQKWEEKDRLLPSQVRRALQTPQEDAARDLRALYRQRLHGLQSHLEGVRHIIVLPSRTMAGIPIEALTDRYLISYAPSATLYAWLRQKGKDSPAPRRSLLAVGDPAFAPAPIRASSAAKAPSLTRWLRGASPKRLPGARGEVLAIARLFTARKAKTEVYVGREATGLKLEQLVREDALARFGYLILATHAHADPWGGMGSYLALAPAPEDRGAATHSRLSAGEIMRTWHLRADLVTLSACETALGEHRGGEGYLGFAQALFVAGARSLVLSQWQVHDYATTLLMHRMYENLLGARADLPGPLAKVAALGEAKRWLRGLRLQEAVARLKALAIPVDAAWVNQQEDHPFEHPYYWAAFILVGDGGR
jgi:CHAT domain-containing protein